MFQVLCNDLSHYPNLIYSTSTRPKPHCSSSRQGSTLFKTFQQNICLVVTHLSISGTKTASFHVWGIVPEIQHDQLTSISHARNSGALFFRNLTAIPSSPVAFLLMFLDSCLNFSLLSDSSGSMLHGDGNSYVILIVCSSFNTFKVSFSSNQLCFFCK